VHRKRIANILRPIAVKDVVAALQTFGKGHNRLDLLANDLFLIHN